MKKLILIITLAFSTVSLAQDLSYGVAFGANVYDINVKGPLEAGAGYSTFNFGGFIDYSLSNSLGIKVHLIYNNLKEDYYYELVGLGSDNDDKMSLKIIEFKPHVKFDVNNTYNKGFYLVGGLRNSFVLDAKNDQGDNFKDFYKSISLGAQLGFGFNLFKFCDFELVGDFSLTNPIESNENNSKTVGAYANVLINLDSIINK